MKIILLFITLLCCSCSVSPSRLVIRPDGSREFTTLGIDIATKSKAQYARATDSQGNTLESGKTGFNASSVITSSAASYFAAQAMQSVSDNTSAVLKSKEVTARQAQAGAEATKQAKIQADLTRDTFVPPPTAP